jgi:hypothetical protein
MSNVSTTGGGWSWKNIGGNDAGGIIGSTTKGAMAGGAFVPGIGHAIGGVVGLALGLGRAGVGEKTVTTTHSAISGDHNLKGIARDPYGGGATWDYWTTTQKKAPDTAIFDYAEAGMQIAGMVAGGFKDAKALKEPKGTGHPDAKELLGLNTSLKVAEGIVGPKEFPKMSWSDLEKSGALKMQPEGSMFGADSKKQVSLPEYKSPMLKEPSMLHVAGEPAISNPGMSLRPLSANMQNEYERKRNIFWNTL